MANIITLAQVKAYLGITDTSLDTEISTYIPIVDAKVKQITGRTYNDLVIGTTTDGSNEISLRSQYANNQYFGLRGRSRNVGNIFSVDDLYEYLEIGQAIRGTGIPDGATITEIYEPNYSEYSTSSSVIVEISDDATATGDGVKVYLGFNSGLLPTVAKGVYWLIDQVSTDTPGRTLASKSMGPVSVSYSAGDQKVDNKSGMPGWFVSAFPHYHGGH